MKRSYILTSILMSPKVLTILFKLTFTHGEHGLEAVLGGAGDGEHSKVADEARRDRVPSAARGSASSADRHVLELLPEQLLAVVHTAKILKQ